MFTIFISNSLFLPRTCPISKSLCSNFAWSYLVCINILSLNSTVSCRFLFSILTLARLTFSTSSCPYLYLQDSKSSSLSLSMLLSLSISSVRMATFLSYSPTFENWASMLAYLFLHSSQSPLSLSMSSLSL